ncbi:pentatricopeptide repeat-containing protein MRL1, chloroplastic isoform X1 [Daucus carota subsp. sativus]
MMIFSPKSQTLSLLSSSNSAFTSPCSLRRQFVGSGHIFRPPGNLCYRKKWKKKKRIGFDIDASRGRLVVVKASISSQSIVVLIAVVAVSAITAAYLNYRQRKPKQHELPGPVDDQNTVHDKEDNAELASSSHSRTAILSSLPVLQAQSNAHPVDLDLEEEEIVVKQNAQESKSSSDLALSETVSQLDAALVLPNHTEIKVDQVDKLRHEIESSAATVSLNCVVSGVVELDKPNDETIDEARVDKYAGNGDSVRRELHTFYEANQSHVPPGENSDSVKPVHSHASSSETYSIYPLNRSYINGAKFSTLDILPTSGNHEGRPHLGFSAEVSFRKSKGSGKRHEFFSQNEREMIDQNGHRSSLISSYIKEKHINERRSRSERSTAYRRLLKEGRLVDCLELLEDMEKQNLLDMDKIYHAGFFRNCKTQRAVKEAFRFTKLIPNPTLSTFNMLLSVCASSQHLEGAFQVMQLVQEAELKADCKLYTTLISTCAKCGKVDSMFKVFHEMVNAGVEPNVHTYGALIDGCAKVGMVAKAFGAYGIMRSKNVKPDRVVFNALISACGQSGAVDRAFDVLAEMRAETIPVDPDHVTVGALIKACANAGQVVRAQEVYNMISKYNIRGTPELYTIAINSSSLTGDWEFACNVYNDMREKGVIPDEMFISAFIDVAGHSNKLESAFEILQKAKSDGMNVGIISYSSLMGACSNAKNWQMALELHEEIKDMNIKPTISTMNALITALCDGDQLQKALEVLSDMKKVGLCPNTITYSILLVACEKNDDLEVGLMLLSQAKKDGIAPNLVMCRCLIALCLRRFEKSCTLGEDVLSLNSGRPQIDSKWTSIVLRVYREAIIAGVVPTTEEFSQVLGCLRLPHDSSLRARLIENLGVIDSTSNNSNLCSLLDGFGEYDPRAFSLLEEAASLGILPSVSFKDIPIVVDVRNLQIHSAEVFLLTVLKSLKHRLAAGVKLPNIIILLPIDKIQVQSSKGDKMINLAGRTSRAVAALLRRLAIPYIGNESFGKIRINGVVVKKWLQPKLTSPFRGKLSNLNSSQSHLGRNISLQQRNIRIGNLSLE